MKKIIYTLLISYFTFNFLFNTKYNFVSNNDFLKHYNNDSVIMEYDKSICIQDFNNTSFFDTVYVCSKYITPEISVLNMSSTSFNNAQTKNNSIFSNFLFNFLLPVLVVFYAFNKFSIGKITDTVSDIKVNNDKIEGICIENFVGCNNIKNEIQEVILQVKHNEFFNKKGCVLPKGILLLGPPGCGKTHLVKTIINATGINYIFISGSDINKIFVGSGSLTINQMFKKARDNKPCLIFIDEADSIIKKREYANVSAVSTEFGSTLCKLLAEMDSLNSEPGILIIFATNMNEQFIDKAVMRAGRIDKIINITEPTFDERIDLFKMYLKDLYDENKIDLQKLSKVTSGLTGSDIKKIVNATKITKVTEYINNVTLNFNDNNTNNNESNTLLNNCIFYKFLSKLLPSSVIQNKNFITRFSNYPLKNLYHKYLKKNNQLQNKNIIESKKENNVSNQENNLSNQENNLSNQENNLSNQELQLKDKEDNELKEKLRNFNYDINTKDLDIQVNKCILGLEREKKINNENRKLISYHEAGHAVISFLLKDSTLPTKICISITSKTLGYTMYLNDEEDIILNTSLNNLLRQIMILYGGRCAEIKFLNEVTCGAEDDYMKARKILKRIIMNGMLIEEYNYVEDVHSKENKVPEEVEKIMNKVNKFIINKIYKLYDEYKMIMDDVADVIFNDGSTTDDGIKEIFQKYNLQDKIQNLDIRDIHKQILENI